MKIIKAISGIAISAVSGLCAGLIVRHTTGNYEFSYIVTFVTSFALGFLIALNNHKK